MQGINDTIELPLALHKMREKEEAAPACTDRRAVPTIEHQAVHFGNQFKSRGGDRKVGVRSKSGDRANKFETTVIYV